MWFTEVWHLLIIDFQADYRTVAVYFLECTLKETYEKRKKRKGLL